MSGYLTTVLAGAAAVTGVAAFVHVGASPDVAQARDIQYLIDATHAHALATTSSASVEFAHLAHVLTADERAWHLDPAQQQAFTNTPHGCVTLTLDNSGGFVSPTVEVHDGPCR